jgi:hypothetical protein
VLGVDPGHERAKLKARGGIVLQSTGWTDISPCARRSPCI